MRSYVTNPTTIKAMTEIPAKTPRPIGRTDSFLPGSWKGSGLSEACSAAAADAAAGSVVLALALSAPAVTDVGVC